MARSYAKLLTSIWRDGDFRALDQAAQWLYLLLISQPDVSAAGVLPIRFSKWARMASDTDVDGIEAAFERLIAGRFVIIDETTEEALIRSFIRHDGGANHPNFHKAIVTAIANIESGALQTVAGAELDNAAGNKPSEPHPNGIRTLSERERHSSSQQPAPSASTSSQQPAAVDTPSPNGSPAPTNDHAAAAVEVLITHRLSTQQPNNPGPYATKVRKEAWKQHGDQLRTAAIPAECGDPARWLAVHVLGMTQTQAMAAGAARRRNGGTAA